MFLFVEYLQQIKGSKCPSLTCLVYNPVAGGGGHEGFPMSTVTKINEAKVLFVKQARAAMSGGLVNELLNDIKALLSSHEEDSQVIPESSTFESGWDAVNYHVKSIKGGDIMILKMRLAKADNKFPETQEMLQKLGAFTTNRSGMLRGIEAYRVSKTLAEQAALQYGKEHDLDVVTIIPVIVVGSSITPTVPISVQLALSLLTGIPSDLQVLKELQLPSGALSLVHVDDLCKAHIFLMENPSTEGRYICNATDIPVAQLAHYLSKRYPKYNVPTQFEDVPVISKLNPSSKKLVESGFSFKLGLDEIFDDAVKYLKMKGMLN